MISVENIGVSFGGFDLFKGVSFLINRKDRIGLAGKNGSGKSTLLKILAGKLNPSEGNTSLPKDVKIGYLPQQMIIKDTRSLKDETILAFDEILGIEKNISKINHELAERGDYESQAYLGMINQVTELNERFRILGGENYEAEVEQTLKGLGFENKDFNRATSEFSGGWRMRIELAKILLQKPDVFLLDEPTNHLDIESIQWLEDFLKNYNGAVMLVSHDKAFLDNLTTRTIEISVGRIYDQRMNYSQYIQWKKEQREQQLAAYKNQQKLISDTEQFIERFRYKATKAVQVQSRIKQLDKLERIEIEPEDNSSLNLKFPPAPRSGSVIVDGKRVSKNYGDLQVLNDIDLIIEKNEKVAFVGRNGEGKTTLAKIILDEIDFKGALKIGHNVKIGYFAQNQADLLDTNKTVLETIDHIAVGDIRTKIRDVLGAFMFSGEDVDKKVKVLSGGERTRLAMIKLLLEPVNFLVLDEPTNHLDMRSKEILKNALADFDGTILVISHDREFLDGLVNCVYEFRNKKVKQYLGGIYDFLQRKKIESLKELERKKETPPQQKDKKPVNSKSLLTFEDRKEINRMISRKEKNIVSIEEKISELEKKIENADIMLSQPELISDSKLFNQYEQLKKELENLMGIWELEHEDLENWKSKKNW
ncbi:MAG: ABC-F family ATP-binding cassette domain-containing protein [Prolixibacteraceae bacterium]|nr:ABC-F family ATP-binding cassette domain-containing protein [Prolixibacteraceae bacterium]MBN2774689.1 ABC-F family ATP-binding cassette domain-containing protein [Prolixibacteraceae bacterium]